jgi:hypothetical protein
MLALAPELDSRFQRLYGFAQDDVTRRWLTVDLASCVLGGDSKRRFQVRRRFGAEAPLIRHGLIRVLAEPAVGLLGAQVKLDEQILRLLIGEEVLDERVAGFTQRSAAGYAVDDLFIRSEVSQQITLAVGRALETGARACLFLSGRDAGEKRRAVHSVAAALGREVLEVDPSSAPTGSECTEASRVLLRQAWYWGNLIWVQSVDNAPFVKALVTASELTPGALLISLEDELKNLQPPEGAVWFAFRCPDASRRKVLWQSALAGFGLAIPDGAAQTLGARFRLTSDQIERSAAAAAARNSLQQEDDSEALVSELSVAARSQTGQALGSLARKVNAVATWDDIVLPQESLAQLREMCARVALRDRILNDWGFGRKLSRGRGVHALFSGPSGTGKTMAAEVVANDLGLDLYRIDLSSVVSKYIGETEKNLERIFVAAEETSSILLFDEADALMGKRSSVHDAHDRYANIEISYLLQRMEEYDGISILATNLRGNLDEAFVRRLAFSVHFPFPEAANRKRIWEVIWPERTPLDPALDFDKISATFKLTGGNIRNIALAAAYLAAEAEERIGWVHIERALRREYQKIGKVLDEDGLENFSTTRTPAREAVA